MSYANRNGGAKRTYVRNPGANGRGVSQQDAQRWRYKAALLFHANHREATLARGSAKQLERVVAHVMLRRQLG